MYEIRHTLARSVACFSFSLTLSDEPILKERNGHAITQHAPIFQTSHSAAITCTSCILLGLLLCDSSYLQSIRVDLSHCTNMSKQEHSDGWLQLLLSLTEMGACISIPLDMMIHIPPFAAHPTCNPPFNHKNGRMIRKHLCPIIIRKSHLLIQGGLMLG